MQQEEKHEGKQQQQREGVQARQQEQQKKQTSKQKSKSTISNGEEKNSCIELTSLGVSMKTNQIRGEEIRVGPSGIVWCAWLRLHPRTISSSTIMLEER